MLTPKYFLVHETPAGNRYAYPRADVNEAVVGAVPRSWDYPSKVEVRVTKPEGAQVRVDDKWIISDAELVEVVREVPGKKIRDGWIKRAQLDVEGPVSPDLAAAYTGAPERPTDSAVEHYSEHGAEHVCWECKVFVAVYQQHFVAGVPEVFSATFEEWLPLPGEADPDPSLGWVVSDTSKLAVYGSHTAHLWPGGLPGLREAVADRLKAHPLVTDFYDWHGRSRDHNGFSMYIRVPWETPRTKTETYKPYGARKPRQRVVAEFAMTERVDLFVPDLVGGATKAEALVKFDAVVEAQVARFFPFGLDPKACDHCNGMGWVRGDGG